MPSCEYLTVDMHYEAQAAILLAEIVEKLQEIDHITAVHPSHKLDSFDPLIRRLDSIREDLSLGNRLLPAIRKTNDLNARLAAVSDLANPRYRSTLAALLGSYQPRGKPPKSGLGGLKGGRPRKDGRPVQTLESKGYSAATLPPKKDKTRRVHPPLRPPSLLSNDRAAGSAPIDGPTGSPAASGPNRPPASEPIEPMYGGLEHS